MRRVDPPELQQALSRWYINGYGDERRQYLLAELPVRFSYATSLENLREGVQRLNHYLT